MIIGKDFFVEEERLFDLPQDDVPRNIFFLSLVDSELNSCILPGSTLLDSTRSQSTLSDPSTSSLGKRKDAPTPSPPDSIVRPLKRANISDEQNSRTELPQDPGAPYIIVRKI